MRDLRSKRQGADLEAKHWVGELKRFIEQKNKTIWRKRSKFKKKKKSFVKWDIIDGKY